MSKAAVVGVVVIVGIGVVGGGGYYYLTQKVDHDLHNAINLVQKSVPGTTINYEKYSVNVFSQTATLNKVVVKDAQGHEYTADTVVLGGFSSKDNNDISLGNLAVDKIQFSTNGGDVTIAHADVKNINAPAGAIVIEDGKIKKVYISKLKFDTLNFQDINAVGPDTTGVKIAQYTLSNYGMDRNSDQTLKQLEIKGTADGQESLKLNSAQIDGFNIAHIADQIEQNKTPKAILGQPSKAIVEGLDANVDGQNWALDKFYSENSANPNGDLKNSANFTGLKISTAHNLRLYPLKQLGYDQLDASGNVVGMYDKAKQVWSFSPFNLTIKDMGNLGASLKFNAPEDLSSIDTQQLLAAYKLISFKMVLKDQGLLQKLYVQQANKANNAVGSSVATGQKVTPDQAKQNIINEIKQDAQSATIPVQKQGDDALLQLINDPKKSLVIEMNPAAPVTATDLMGKSQIEMLDVLKLSVKAEEVK